MQFGTGGFKYRFSTKMQLNGIFSSDGAQGFFYDLLKIFGSVQVWELIIFQGESWHSLW